MKYTTVLFDLDGTITDSKPGILNSIRYALTDCKCRLMKSSRHLSDRR